MKNTRMRMLAVVIAAGALTLGGAQVANASSGGGSGTCTGGEVSGTYTNLTIAGYCQVPQGATLTVTGNVTVNPGAVLDAQSYSATVSIGKNVTAGAGSMLGLGCQSPESVGNTGHPCLDGGNAVVTVGGNITATDPMAILINGVSVAGNVSITGGGSEEIPWSIKNNTIDGNITMSGQTTNWIGVLFNHIGGNATFTNIAIEDPDMSGNGMYIGHNVVGHNLNCSGITPKVSPGFGPVPNMVGGKATGQCAALV